MGNTGSSRGDHALGGDHLVIGCFGLIVEDHCDKSHQANDVVGGSFQEDAADRHVATHSAKLVGGDYSMSRGTHHHFVAPYDLEAHVHCSTD